MYCHRFLRFLQSRGVADFSLLTYPLLSEYASLLPSGDTGISMTGVFLKFLPDEGCCSAGLYWYFHYYREKWLLCPGDLLPEQHALIEACRSESRMLPLAQYQEALDRYPEDLKRKGYQSTVLLHSRRALRLERRLGTLKKHLEQAGIYFKYKGKKPLTEAEQIRRNVYNILRQEQREQQPGRAQDMER